MLTSEEVFALQKVSTDAKGVTKIAPILTDMSFSKQSSLGIEVIAVNEKSEDKKREHRAHEDEEGDQEVMNSYVFVPDPIVIRDNSDPATWYHVFNKTNISFMTKFKFNRPVWRHCSFFPGVAEFVVMCRDWILVVLDNEEIHFIDPENGCPCYPSVLTSGKCIFIKAIDDKVICFTKNQFLYVWRLFDESKIECLIQVQWIGHLPPVQDIILVNEIANGDLCPVLVTSEFTVRYSQSQDGWLFCSYKLPSMFKPMEEKYDTTLDCEKAFFEAMMYHNGPEFLETFTILMRCWMLQESKEKVIELMNEAFSLASDGCTRIGGVSMRNVLETGMSILSEGGDDLVSEIQETYDKIMESLPNETLFSPDRILDPIPEIESQPFPVRPPKLSKREKLPKLIAAQSKETVDTKYPKDVLAVIKRMKLMLEKEGSDIQITPENTKILQDQLDKKPDMLESAKASLTDIDMVEIIVRELLTMAEREELEARTKTTKKAPKKIDKMHVEIPSFSFDEIKDFVEISRDKALMPSFTGVKPGPKKAEEDPSPKKKTAVEKPVQEAEKPFNVKALLRNEPDLVTKFKLPIKMYKKEDIEAIGNGSLKIKQQVKRQPKVASLTLVPETAPEKA